MVIYIQKLYRTPMVIYIQKLYRTPRHDPHRTPRHTSHRTPRLAPVIFNHDTYITLNV